MGDATSEPGDIVDAWAAVVVDAAVEVRRHLGPAFAESVYENALSRELELRDVPFERQVAVPIEYKGLPVGEGRLDILVGAILVVELKALPALLPLHVSQVATYLTVTGLPLGLLLNFGDRVLKGNIRRVIRSH